MNGLSPNVDLTPLEMEQVLQLCFGEHQAQIHFDQSKSILIESTCVLREEDGLETRIEVYSKAASALCRLLGQRVVSANRVSEGGMLLRFASGVELEILNDNGDYESFQILIGEKTYVA